MVQLQKGAAEIKAAGLQVIGVSYDSEEILKGFAKKSGVEFPLLSDSESKVIKQFGLLNKKAREGSRQYGIPHPMTVLVGQDSVVKGTIPGTVRDRHNVEQLVATWAKVKGAPAAKKGSEAETATKSNALSSSFALLRGYPARVAK